MADREPKKPSLNGGDVPEIEVSPQTGKRSFSAAYKRRILEEADACSKQGEVGALLRREGLYSSQLSKWRKQLDRHGLEGLKAKKRGRRARPDAQRIRDLERENRRLRKDLEQAETIIAVQEKLATLLRRLEDDEDDASA